MRRKNSRNTKNLTPEKTKPESPRKSHRQSSKRRKRSSSSSEESDELQSESKDSVQVQIQDSTAYTDIVSDSDLKGSEKSEESFIRDSKTQDERSMENVVENFSPQDHVLSSKEDDKEFEEGKQEIEEIGEKRNKGKSKGKNNSNIEQSSNNIDPETENENVQGTRQSPSNDYADNENVVQNVNDTTKFNPEIQDDKCEEITVTENEELKNIPEANFISEYAKINESSQDNENNVEAEQSDIVRANIFAEENKTSYQFCYEKKLTAPESKNNEENSTSRSKVDEKLKMRSSNQDTEKLECSESAAFKKKITLRRSPPESKEIERVAPTDDSALKARRSSFTDESKKSEEGKPTKKITLKRHTTDDSGNSEVHMENKNHSISRSLSEEVVERRRRLSSLGEDKEQIKEDKPKKVLKPIKLIRTLSRNDKENDEDKIKRTVLRRQKWGRSDWLNKLTSTFYKVDVESIKIVCPSLEFLSENEITLESTPRERRKSESDHKRKMSIDNKSEDSDRPDYEKQTSEESSGEPKVETNPNIIAMNRKISIVEDTASKLRPPPSPAKHPPSDVLFITNLVRPFTVKQLKELLERTGKIKEEGFWTDRIKSKCYVQYESAEEAEATRNALHGVHWPIGNGKKLVIDYATVEDLQKAKDPPAPIPAVLPEKLTEKENREPERGDKFKDREREDRRKKDAPVREWDLGKEDSRRRSSRSRSKSRGERVKKHSRRSYTPDDYLNSKRQRKVDDSIPQKLMDDLFLKTKATPSIYWQPLSPEEIATKQQQRLVRMEEHKRRIEETRGRPRDGRRFPFRRR